MAERLAGMGLTGPAEVQVRFNCLCPVLPLPSWAKTPPLPCAPTACVG